jgi:hypothetical protein
MSREELINLAKDKLGPVFVSTDEQVLKNIGDTVIDEALDCSHRAENDENLKSLKAIIVETIVIAYQNRGSEGLKSQSELGQSNSFVDWMEYLQNNIIQKGKRFLF